MNIGNLGSKGSLWVKFNNGICAELCLKLWFEKVTVQKSIAELWTVVSDQMINYQLPHGRFEQISDLKHDILVWKATHETISAGVKKKQVHVFKKVDDCFFLKYSFGELFFLIGLDSMQGWTATTRHGVTRKGSTKRLKDTGNLFRKNLQLKDTC